MFKGVISIWFFIGVLLTVYGVLILGTGIGQVYSPPVGAFMLAHLHLAIWWGGAMLVLGGVYTVRFWPGKR